MSNARIDSEASFAQQAAAYRERPAECGPALFAPFTRDGELDWEWRGDAELGTLRAIALLAEPERVGNAQVSLALARIPAGAAAPWHFHRDHEEFVYVLDGDGEFWCDGQLVSAVEHGSVNIIPPGSWHTHRALGHDLVFVWGYAPPGPHLSG